MDEAVVRIILQDEGAATPGAGGTPAGGSNAGAGMGTNPAPTTGGAQGYTPITGRFVGRYDDVDMGDVEFFKDQAQRRRKREEVLQKIDEMYHEMFPTPEEQFDPTVEAQRLLDARKRREEIYREIDRLDPSKSEERAERYLRAEAQAALQVEKKRQAAEDREQKLLELEARAALNVARAQDAAIPVVEALVETLEETPFQRAKNKYEAKQRRDETDAEYKKHFEIEEVESSKGVLDDFLGLAKQFRGSIGGKAGTLLDMSSLMGKHGGNLNSLAGAGAAGPMGMALMAKEIGEKINKEIVEGIKNTIGSASKIANLAASANADPAVPIAAFGDSLTRAGEKLDENFIPIIGKVAIVGGEAAKALASFMQEVSRTADRYGEYNAQIAQAQAIAEVRQTLGDFRRAQEGGPQLARFVQNQADLQQRFEDIKIKLLTRILEVVNPILAGTELFVSGAQNIADAINTFAAPLTNISQGIARIAHVQEKAEEDVVDPTEIILGRDQNGAFRFPGGQAGPINQLP